MPSSAYIGRFAPSPTGALHAGSLVAALASWLDARAHHGQWLVRMEDVDTPRCSAEAQRTIMRQLQQHALVADSQPWVQSQRAHAYQHALDSLVTTGLAYPCGCSRQQIAALHAAQGHKMERHAERVYPGTCHPSQGGLHGKPARAWRLDVSGCQQRRHLPTTTHWYDRRLGAQQQDVASKVGDFVLRRADRLWAYQLAVVVDDAAQGITHVVRGADLVDNTARQIVLQNALHLPTPHYLHTPVVLGANGEKLSKQNAAQPLPQDNANKGCRHALANLQAAAQVLGLGHAPSHAAPADALAGWVPQWAALYNICP